MTDLFLRRLLFLTGCMGTRTAFTWAAATQKAWQPLLRAIAAAFAVGFLAIWAFGLRRTGAETFGAPIWWDGLRPVHATLWGLWAAFPAYWQLLAADTALGLGAFLVHHFG